MLVSDLKKILNDLPPKADGYSVEFMSQVIPLSEGRWARQDEPVFGSILDEANGEFVLASKQQLDQFSAYAQQDSNPGCNPVEHLSTIDAIIGQQNRK